MQPNSPTPLNTNLPPERPVYPSLPIPPAGKPPRNKLVIIIICIVVLIVAGGIVFIFKPKNKPKPSLGTSSNNSSTTSASSQIRLLAAGDFIAHDSINAAAKQADGSYNYLPLMSDFLPIFKAADIRFCNDAILNGGNAFGITGYPKFNSPTEFVRDMNKLGCNLVNTASNHSFDRTQAAIDASVNAWAAQPNMLAVAGENRSVADQQAVHYFDEKGVKFAFLAYTTYSNTDAKPVNNFGLNVFSRNFASQQIAAAKKAGAKVIIASMRWGTEYTTTVNAEQKADAQFLADQGVNLILGHGSHELEPVQSLTGANGNKTIVWYSLGNFINTQEPPETLFNGLAVINIDTKTFKITSQQFIPIYMHYEWTPSQAKADDISARINLHMYLLEDAKQSMVDSQQLHTTIPDQKTRLEQTLNTYLKVSLITSKEFLAQ